MQLEEAEEAARRRTLPRSSLLHSNLLEAMSKGAAEAETMAHLSAAVEMSSSWLVEQPSVWAVLCSD